MQALIRTHAGLLFAGVATFVSLGIGQSIYGPALPAISRILMISEAEAGMLVSAHWVGSAVGIAAIFAFGNRVTPRIALGIMTLGLAGLAAMAGFWPTLAAAVVYGTGFGMATTVFNPRVLAAFADRGPSMLGLLNASYGIGAILSPLAFVRMGSDPQLSYGLTAAVCAGIWLCAGPASRVAVSPGGAVRPFRPYLPILAFGAVAIGLEACLVGLGPTALVVSGLTEDRAAEMLSVFFVLFVASRLAVVFVAHLAPAFTLFTGAIILAALCAGVAVAWSPAAGFVGLGLPAGLFFPAYYVTATKKMGDDHRVPPTIIAAGLVGGILAPLLFAPLAAGLGDRGFFWIVLAVAGTTTVLAFLSLRAMNR